MSQALVPPLKSVKRQSASQKEGKSLSANAVKSVFTDRSDYLSEGKIVRRLTDPKARTVVTEIIRNAVSSPENAHQYLVRLGTLTKAGKVTRKYGGK